MLKLKQLVTLGLLLLMLVSCNLHDTIITEIKRKAVVHLVYHYNNGTVQTLNGVESMRLLIYDQDGIMVRDTTMTPAEFLQDGGSMHTYISNGNYSLISWANIGTRTQLINNTLAVDTSGADCLMYGRCDTPIVKGDSIRFEVHLFKSVFKINVKATGLRSDELPNVHYFGLMNRNTLSMDNQPLGDNKRYRPRLQFEQGKLSGSFYTPYFKQNDDLVLGIYTDDLNLPYSTLCETTIRQFATHLESEVGQDVEINVDIDIKNADITIRISDWDGNVIQEEIVGR